VPVQLVAQRRKGFQWAGKGKRDADRCSTEVVEHDLHSLRFQAADPCDAGGILEDAKRRRPVAELGRGAPTLPPRPPRPCGCQAAGLFQVDGLTDLERDQHMADSSSNDGGVHFVRPS